MSIISLNGRSIGSKSGALFASKQGSTVLSSPATYNQPLSKNEDVFGDVAIWGTDNLLPQKMAADIESTGVLSAAIDGKARIAIGKGPMPARVVSIDKDGYEELEFVRDNQVSDWLEMNNAYENGFATTKDLFGWGNAWTQLLLSADRRKIVGFKRHDPTECRFSKRSLKSRRSETVYLCGDWSQYTAYSKETAYVGQVPLLDKDYPLFDLQGRSSGYTFMLSIQYPLFGRQYYSPSPWYAARKWVRIAQGIPEMKEAMFHNQMTIKYVVEIHDDFWQSLNKDYRTMSAAAQRDLKDSFYDQIDEYLVGGDKAYKSIFSTKVLDRQSGQLVSAIEITVLDDKIKDGKLLPDSAAANGEILFALMMNPALMGADMPGGPYSGGAGSGSNIREAHLVQVMLLELERRAISKPFELAKHYNGWDTSIVLRYPNQLLTTLSTGASTKTTA